MLRADRGRQEHERRVGGWPFVAGTALCAGLIGGLVSPVWAAPPGDGASEVQLGSFALGDALEGTIGESDGSFGFTLSAGGVQLGWDSRIAGTDAVRLGGGWSFGLATVRVTGGVWVHPASGGAFEMAETSPTGLAGYPGQDVAFERAEPGAVVPARTDGVLGETPYAYVLHELGGVSTYFDEAGYPVAKLVEGGDRVDWQWKAGGSGRLQAIVGPDGSLTSLNWSDPSRLVIEPGSNIADPLDGSGAGGRWTVEFDGGQVSAVAGPAGGSTRVGYDRHGLVERVSTPSGASTVVQWQRSADGVARVEQVRLVDDETGAELSSRHWSAQGEVAPSGWPLIGAPVAAAGAVPGYEAWLSDGKTRVRSTVDGWRRLTARAVSVTAGSGERIVQEQAFEYPEQDADPGAPVARMKPTSATTTHHDRHGGTRSASESYAFDELGRMVSRTTVTGATTRRTYDPEVAPGRSLPIGLVLDETTTAADGLMTSTRSEVSEDRAAVVADETWSGREGDELVRVGRVESDVEQGFVSEQRTFPGGDPAVAPVVTRWSKQVDPGRGTKTVVQTEAASTAIERSRSTVSSLVHGGVLSASDAVGNVASARFDEAGRQVSAVDAAGRSVARQYLTRQIDGVNAVTVTDDTGVAVTETRDVLGRVVRKTDNIAPSGRAVAGYERVFESREYDAPGVERVTDAWGAATTTELDVFGRVQRVMLPSGVMQVAEHDDVAGSATSGVTLTGELSDAELTSTTTQDPAGRVSTSAGSRADGVPVPETTIEVDGFGREVRSSDGRRSTATQYDVFGNAVVTDVSATGDAEGVGGAGSAGVIAERRYDAFGVSVEKTLRSDAESSAGQRRELDEFGRVVSQTDQRGVTERTAYTSDGLVAEVVSDTGRVTTHEYDPRSRALVGSRVSSPQGATVETSLRYDEAGRLIAVFDPANEVETVIRYEFDDFGNRTRTTYPDGTEVRHEFDRHGRKAATIDVDGNRTEYAYDGTDGSMVAAMQADREGVPVGGVRYAYDDYGRVSSLERENGVRTEYTFTSAAQVSAEATTGPDGVVSEREYAYSPAGLLISRNDRTADEAGQVRATRTEYEYDVLDRLVGSSVREGDAPDGRVVLRTEYEPTVGGDLASETVVTEPGTAEEASTTRRFEYSEVGELAAIVTDGEPRIQEFDADGRLLASASGGRYEYDAAGRPVGQTTSDGVRIDTSYWADGARREHTTATGATRFYWDGGTLLNEVHDTADEHGTASYLIGANRHARSTRAEDGAAGTSYYGTDRHGNVTDLTDQAGAIVAAYAYTDYGVATVTGDGAAPLAGGIGELAYNPFQYAGEYTYRDGTQALGARIYDAVQARFLSKDAAPLANLYAFGDLNPITNVDPTGRSSELDWSHLGPLIAGFVVAVGVALASVFSGGAALGAFGMVGGLIAGGDAVLAGFEVARGFGKVHWADPQAMEIASWSFFAASIATGIGGAIAKYATRGGKQVATTIAEVVPSRKSSLAGGGGPGDNLSKEVITTTTETGTPGRGNPLALQQDPTVLDQHRVDILERASDIGRHQAAVQSINLEELRAIGKTVGDAKSKMHLKMARGSLALAENAAAKHLTKQADAVFSLADEALAKTLRTYESVEEKVFSYLTAAHAQLTKAENRMIKLGKLQTGTDVVPEGMLSDLVPVSIARGRVGEAIKPARLLDDF